MFLQAAIDPTVQWRHGKYKLKWGGLAEEVCVNKYEQKKLPSHNITSFTSTTIDNEVKEPLLQSALSSPSQSLQQLATVV